MDLEQMTTLAVWHGIPLAAGSTPIASSAMSDILLMEYMQVACLFC